MAWGLLDSYKEYNIQEVKEAEDEIPNELYSVLAMLPPKELPRLKAFMVQDMMTMSEMKDLFGQMWTVQFIQVSFYELELVRRRRNYFMWDESLRTYIQKFLKDGESRPAWRPPAF